MHSNLGAPEVSPLKLSIPFGECEEALVRQTVGEAERRALRKKNGNVFAATADGTVYMSLSGGVVSDGVTFEAVRLADYWSDRIRNLQVDFEERALDKLLPALKQQGFGGEDELEAKLLELSETGMGVFFPKYSVRADVKFTVPLSAVA